MTEKIEGYVLTLHQRIPNGPSLLIDPGNRPDRLREAKNTPSCEEKILPLEVIQAVLITSPEILRQFEMDLLLQLAHTDEASDVGVYPIKLGEVARWKLLPMHRVTAEWEDGELIITSVEGLTDPEDVKALAYYGNLRLERGDLRERLKIERLEEISKNPPPDILEGQLRDIRKGGIVLMRMLSYLAMVIKGMFMLDLGPEKSGKTFLTRMVLYFLRWVYLPTHQNARLIIIGVGERPRELHESEGLAEGNEQISAFLTSFDDLPTTLWRNITYAGTQRAKREIELGREVIVVLESVSRVAAGISLSEGDEGRATGGQKVRALVASREIGGLAGRYLLLDGGETLCTVWATALFETHPFHDAPATQMIGTGDGDIRHTNKAGLRPKLDLQNGHTSTRDTSWVEMTPLEHWFVEELERRVAKRGKGGRYFDHDAAIEYLKNLFENATPQEVMEEWDRVRRKNKLFTAFKMGPDQTRVAIDELDLTFEQVQELVNATVADDLVELFEAGCDISGFLAKEVTKVALYKALEKYRQEWSNEGYTEALPERDKTLSNNACDPLREAGIPASLVRKLVTEGHDFSDIIEVARRRAGPDDIRKHLGKAENNKGD